MINTTIIHILDFNLIVIFFFLLYSFSDGKTSKESIPLITLLRQILSQRSFGTHIFISNDDFTLLVLTSQ